MSQTDALAEGFGDASTVSARQASAQPPTLFRRGRQNDIIALEWTTLRSTWDELRGDSGIDPQLREAIDCTLARKDLGLAKWASDSRDWDDLNLAQQRMAGLLRGARLREEFKGLLTLARERQIPGLATHEEADAALFQTDSKDDDDGVRPSRTAALQRLLFELQQSFVNSRYERRLAQEASRKLIVSGLAAIGFAVVALVVYSFTFSGTAMSEFPPAGRDLLLAVSFGVLGAYFSRLQRFQYRPLLMKVDDFIASYALNALATRMIFGLIGSVVFYYVVRGGLVGGDLLPTRAPGTGQLSDTSSVSKLIVWSFLAGFSERLVHDTLDRMSSHVRDAAGDQSRPKSGG